MKEIKLRNKLNGEKFITDSFNQTEFIDGIEYLVVRKIGQDRRFLMRKDSLEKETIPKTVKPSKLRR